MVCRGSSSSPGFDQSLQELTTVQLRHRPPHCSIRQARPQAVPLVGCRRTAQLKEFSSDISDLLHGGDPALEVKDVLARFLSKYSRKRSWVITCEARGFLSRARPPTCPWFCIRQCSER